MADQNPTSKQEALMQFVIGEVTPLINQAQDVNKVFSQLVENLKSTHTEINDDLVRLGNIVETVAQSKDSYRNEAKAFTEHLDTKMDEIKLTIQTSRALQAKKRSIWMPVLLSTILTACVVFGGVYYFYSTELKTYVQIGQKIQSEWPQYSKQERDKINNILAK